MLSFLAGQRERLLDVQRKIEYFKRPELGLVPFFRQAISWIYE
jgi:hypothetical protein